MLAALACLAACGPTAKSSTSGVPLSRLAWCEHPTIAFTDEGVVPAVTITDWARARQAIGFDPLLPPTLPSSTCLVSAGGVAHDPVFGSRFIITYALANHGALSFVESPAQRTLLQPQCSAAATTSSTTIATCQATLQGIEITASGTQSAAALSAQIATLKPGIDWVPAS
jgi:hypothetical protein